MSDDTHAPGPLAAAAPEMLKALQWILDDFWDEKVPLDRQPTSIELALAAVAKARGQI